MDRLFVDTSAWLANVNRTARRHREVRAALRDFDGRLVTSNFVFDETVTLAQRSLGHPMALLMGNVLLDRDVVDLVRLTSEDEAASWSLFKARSDKDYSFTDCTSFVLMRRLGLVKAAALDADFAQEGFQVFPGR